MTKILHFEHMNFNIALWSLCLDRQLNNWNERTTQTEENTSQTISIRNNTNRGKHKSNNINKKPYKQNPTNKSRFKLWMSRHWQHHMSLEEPRVFAKHWPPSYVTNKHYQRWLNRVSLATSEGRTYKLGGNRQRRHRKR